MRPTRATALTLVALALTWAPALPAATTAFVNATVHPVSAPTVENATLVVEDGVIVALAARAEAPAGAAVVDLAGKHVYPGFVHPASTLGLTEISSVRGTVDTREMGDMNAHLRAEVAFNADSMLLPVAASGGVLTANVMPLGGVFRGTSAVMRVEGWNWEDMTLQAPVGMHLAYPRTLPPSRSWRPTSQEDIDKEKEKALELLNDTLEAARAYRKALDAEATGSGPAVTRDLTLAALLPVLAGELPLYIHAAEKSQIESALEWAEEQELDNLVLVSGADAQYVAARLAAAEIPVILDGVLERPGRDWEPYDAAYVAAARLHEAGVRFAIGDGGSAADVRNLPFHAAMAAAFGLPREVALRAVTLSAAEILGVGDRLGSLEEGKEATFIVTDGDPLEILTTIERAWLAGKELDLTRDRHKRLYEKYRERPRPAGR